ncbi:MAG: response regulator transcription factor, partial [Verrucomicrobiales bacterium]|nr:response regulator transcription factor [Verrucomicrobiales bacterium]
ECVRKLKTLSPSTQFIMLTMYEDDQRVFESLAAGATGYLLKRTSHAQILEAIHDVWSGGAPMTSSIARKVVQSVQRAQAAPPSPATNPPGLAHISPREEEVLRLLAKGEVTMDRRPRIGVRLTPRRGQDHRGSRQHPLMVLAAIRLQCRIKAYGSAKEFLRWSQPRLQPCIQERLRSTYLFG